MWPFNRKKRQPTLGDQIRGARTSPPSRSNSYTASDDSSFFPAAEFFPDAPASHDSDPCDPSASGSCESSGGGGDGGGGGGGGGE